MLPIPSSLPKPGTVGQSTPSNNTRGGASFLQPTKPVVPAPATTQPAQLFNNGNSGSTNSNPLSNPGAQAAMAQAQQRAQASANQAATQAQNAAGYPTTQPAPATQTTSNGEESVASTSNPLWREIGTLAGGVGGFLIGGPGGAMAGAAGGNALGGLVDDATADSPGGGGAGSAGGYAPEASNFVDPYKQANQDLLKNNYTSYQNRTAPIGTGATIGNAATITGTQMDKPTTYDAATGNAAQSANVNIDRSDNEFRQGQTNLIGDLTTAAAGNGPSVATDQMRLAQERALAQQLAAASSARGPINPALQQRELANNAASTNQDIATAAAQQRVQEQLNARTQLSNELSNARQQDIGINTNQAGLNQQTGMANANLNQNMTLANVNSINNAYQTNANAYNTANNQQANLSQGANLANQNALNTNAYQQANLSQDMTKYNLGGMIQTQGQNDAMVQNATNGLTNQSQQAIDNAIKYEDLRRAGIQGTAATAESARQFDQTTSNQAWSNLLGAGVNLYGAYSAANAGSPTNPVSAANGQGSGQGAYDASKGVSDRNAKKNIVPAKEALRKALSKNLYKGKK